MFRISKGKRVQSDEPVITSEYRDILFDEVPILFMGLNRFHSRIIGSSVEEDYARHAIRYFHLILTDGDYRDFRKRKVTYRSLLERSSSIFVIDKIGDKKQIIYQVSFGDIPEKYPPLPSSLCPERELWD